MRLTARIHRLALTSRTHAEIGEVQKMEAVAKQLDALEDGHAGCTYCWEGTLHNVITLANLAY